MPIMFVKILGLFEKLYIKSKIEGIRYVIECRSMFTVHVLYLILFVRNSLAIVLLQK